jgi:hypothetical protein
MSHDGNLHTNAERAFDKEALDYYGHKCQCNPPSFVHSRLRGYYCALCQLPCDSPIYHQMRKEGKV